MGYRIGALMGLTLLGTGCGMFPATGDLQEGEVSQEDFDALAARVAELEGELGRTDAQYLGEDHFPDSRLDQLERGTGSGISEADTARWNGAADGVATLGDDLDALVEEVLGSSGSFDSSRLDAVEGNVGAYTSASTIAQRLDDLEGVVGSSESSETLVARLTALEADPVLALSDEQVVALATWSSSPWADPSQLDGLFQEVSGSSGALTASRLDGWEASPAFGISTEDIIDWDQAHGWGDHAQAGYLSEAEQPELAQLEEFLQVEPGEPAVKFVGANVYVQDGAEALATGCGEEPPAPNGLGNLILGYNENYNDSDLRTGSHNLVVGPFHSYDDVGGLLAGCGQTIDGAAHGVAVGGWDNVISADMGTIAGGVSLQVDEVADTASGLTFHTELDAWEALIWSELEEAFGHNETEGPPLTFGEPPNGPRMFVQANAFDECTGEYEQISVGSGSDQYHPYIDMGGSAANYYGDLVLHWATGRPNTAHRQVCVHDNWVVNPPFASTSP